MAVVRQKLKKIYFAEDQNKQALLLLLTGATDAEDSMESYF